MLLLSVAYLVRVVDGAMLRETWHAIAESPGWLALALGCYAVAFALRSWAWTRMLRGLTFGQSWSALHVSLLGNHLLPFRLGEVLRVTSVLRRTDLRPEPVTATTITLRLADLLSVAALALVAVPGLASELIGMWAWALAIALANAAALAVAWVRRLATRPDAAVRIPGLTIVGTAFAAWALEAMLAWQVAQAAGVNLQYHEAIAVTAVAVAAQTVAVTPGGIGSYEAAGTAALAALGVPAPTAFAIALATHAVKTAYSFVFGAIALVAPAPGYWGRWRLSRVVAPRPAPAAVDPAAPVVAVLPVHNEQDSVGDVVRGLPATVSGHVVRCLVVDDGSTDQSAARAAAAGATVIAHPRNRGLGAAVRTALAEASALSPAAVVYLDADGEYAPEELPAVVAPVLAGEADYVIGSRFSGRIEHMRPHRRVGNLVLTRWVRWMTRQRDLTDGQSGYRAFSARAAAAAEIVHDYNYAQVLTLDLLGKGFRYT
ncbi:MAG TPA: lysylphosphatidylglycerol synthase domain-containing protein, partial [Sporichthya sp.]|nr:lysylphosphatidylglycerol synthase domain-containing protein [Sporichthya sp.]